MHASKVSESGTSTAEITTLDSYFYEHHLPKVEFIKLVVEDAEEEKIPSLRLIIRY